jgi:hypothetical protein
VCQQKYSAEQDRRREIEQQQPSRVQTRVQKVSHRGFELTAAASAER